MWLNWILAEFVMTAPTLESIEGIILASINIIRYNGHTGSKPGNTHTIQEGKRWQGIKQAMRNP